MCIQEFFAQKQFFFSIATDFQAVVAAPMKADSASEVAVVLGLQYLDQNLVHDLAQNLVHDLAQNLIHGILVAYFTKNYNFKNM